LNVSQRQLNQSGSHRPNLRKILYVINGRVFAAGDIVVVKPGEATDFEALTDTTTTVVKLPSAKGDKYLVGG
jgi:hypothetical protein